MLQVKCSECCLEQSECLARICNIRFTGGHSHHVLPPRIRIECLSLRRSPLTVLWLGLWSLPISIASFVFFICAYKKPSATQTRENDFLLKYLEVLAQPGQVETPLLQAPVMCVWGCLQETCGVLQHEGARGTQGAGQKPLCGSQENEILLSALPLLCVALRKSLKCHLLRDAFPGHSVSRSLTSSHLLSLHPFYSLRSTGRCGEPRLYLCAHCFFLLCLPALEGQLHEVRGQRGVLVTIPAQLNKEL